MTFIQENAYLILLNGYSLVEDFNNFRLCGAAASHANTKLPAAKYMAWKFWLLKAIEPAFALWFWEWKKIIELSTCCQPQEYN